MNIDGINFEKNGKVATITLNIPETRNALTLSIIENMDKKENRVLIGRPILGEADVLLPGGINMQSLAICLRIIGQIIKFQNPSIRSSRRSTKLTRSFITMGMRPPRATSTPLPQQVKVPDGIRIPLPRLEILAKWLKLLVEVVSLTELDVSSFSAEPHNL
ncbi:hypothetical protein AN477_16930 [Alicyclobacillus ferrooxydans]|uniref:Uncharacterized protein n=1 Tax=Alicyclobacillus ferrooxydans TaxID=471514 RepID=A0A0P9EID9_9BACL|nr:hypothetical protein AN477_16930 [Alicyclobacillus ferrooxydans]